MFKWENNFDCRFCKQNTSGDMRCFYQSQNIEFIGKPCNSDNCPICHPEKLATMMNLRTDSSVGRAPG